MPGRVGLGRRELRGGRGAGSCGWSQRLAVGQAPLLSLRGITKRFPRVIANDEVDLDVHRGEVLAHPRLIRFIRGAP